MAESQTYWSQAYEAYEVVRDTVSTTAVWSWSAAYSKWEGYTGVPAAVQESNITLLKDLFGPVLVDPQGRDVNLEDVLGNGKYVGIYVGASWASACAPFCAELKRSYEKINERSMLPTLECVYVSADKTQEEFDAYMRDSPWLAVPFTELKLRKKVMTIYAAATLPKFILLSPSGKVLTDDARWTHKDPTGASFPWTGESDALCAIQ